MPNRPILEEFFARELDWCEQALTVERERRNGHRDSVEGIVARGADHHFGKADSHMCRMGSHYTGMDADTGVPHGVLTILRLLMTLRCAFGGESQNV